MFNVFPREFSKYRSIASDSKAFFKYINLNNGFVDCFTNVFDFTKSNFDGNREILDRSEIIIPHILFDMDSDDAFQDMMKLYGYAKTHNLACRIIFSGKGYHFYFIVKINPINTRVDVLLFQNKIISELSITVDCTCIGNSAGLIRIPGTFNLRRDRWAISLKEDELTSHEEILQLGTKQRTKIYRIQGNNLELEHHKSSDSIPDEPLFSTKNLSDIGIDYLMVIPCLRTNILPGGVIPHMERVYLVQYLSDLYRCGISIENFTEDQINELIENIVHFFEPILLDFNEDITRFYVEKIVRKYDFSPSCNSLKKKGMCIDGVRCWRRKC